MVLCYLTSLQVWEDLFRFAMKDQITNSAGGKSVTGSDILGTTDHQLLQIESFFMQ